jgi:hypothetical protein
VIVIVLEAGRAPSLKNEIGRALVLVLRLIVCDAIGETRGDPPGTVKSTPAEDPPRVDVPQVTTEPSVFNAAKASPVEYRRATPDVREADTEELFPPSLLAPHVTTDPFDFSAAKAVSVANTLTTPDVREEATLKLSPPLLA